MLEALKSGKRANGLRGTCDAPLCDNCRENLGTSFECQRSGKGKGCVVDSLDRCRKCAVKARLGLGPLGA